MKRAPRTPQSTIALLYTAASNPERLIADGIEYATLHDGTLYVLYRTEQYYAVLSTNNPTTGTYYENYRKAVDGFEWMVLNR